MNRPAFPQGSLTAEDARFIRQDDAVGARTIKSVPANYYRDMLAAKNAVAKRKEWIKEGLIVTAGAAVMGVMFLVLLPLGMAAFKP